MFGWLKKKQAPPPQSAAMDALAARVEAVRLRAPRASISAPPRAPVAEAPPRPAPAPLAPPPPPPAAAGGGTKGRILVSREEIGAAREPDEAWRASQAVVEFANDWMTTVCGTFEEAPPVLEALYYASYYVGQVRNGGHSLFLSNTAAHLPRVIGSALRGLAAMGARELHSVLADCAALVARLAPEELAERRVGDPALEALDTRFFAADERAAYDVAAARWIAAWPELEMVEADAYAARIEALGRANPRRAARLRHRDFVGLREQLADRLQLSAGVVCGEAREVKLELGSWDWTEIGDGQRIQTFALRTSAGERRLVCDEAGAALIEYAPGGRKPHCFGHADAARIAQVGQAAERLRIVAAADLLLSRIGFPLDAQITPWIGGDASGRFDLWMVAARDKPALTLIADAAGASLSPMADGARHPLARATRGEIEAHLATLEAEAALPPPR